MEITRAELAALIGVSERMITELAKQGIVIRAARGKYQMKASVAAYCEHLRNTAAGRGGKDHVESLAGERARLAREQADGHALKNALLRGDTLDRVEVQATWSGIMSSVRSGMLAVTPRVQQQLPALTLAEAGIIEREIREALRVLGEDGDDGSA